MSPFPLTSVQVISSLLHNNNIAAVKSNNGGNASHVLQFSSNCSQVNTSDQDPEAALQDSTTIKDEEEPPEDALKVQTRELYKFTFIYCCTIVSAFSH